MGYIRHHAIVVTGYTGDVEGLHAVAPGPKSGLGDPTLNGYRTFCVFPDGSKEGWPESDVGDAARQRFISLLRECEGLEWAEVAYGHDDDGAEIERHAWDEGAPHTPVETGEEG